jgi:predicted nucleic acid-binding protein
LIYCLDTDILIEYFRGNDAVRKKIENLTGEDSIGFTWFTIYEFFKGILASGKLEEEKFLRGLVETSHLWKDLTKQLGLVVRFMPL